MADRSRFDVNNRNTLIAVSNADGESTVTLWADPSTHALVTSGSGGGGGADTQYTDGATSPTHPIGTIPVFNNAGTITAVSAANPLPVTAAVTITGVATAVKQSDGSQKTQIVDGSGNVIASTSNALNTSTNITNSSIPVTGTFFQTTQPISGTVTANAGTNLNTSTLALETGGNLAAIKADTDKIPSQGQALAAASTPVVLPVAQITTLTPPTTVTTTQGTAAPITAGWPVIGGELADVTGTFTNATQTTSITSNSFDGYSTVIVSINGTYGTATGVFEISDDGGTTWYSVNAARTDGTSIETGYTSLTNTNRMWTLSVSGADEFRVRSTAVASGIVNVRLSIESMPTPEAASVSAYQATAANFNATVVGTGIFVTQSTLAAETTKVIGTVNVAASQTIAVTNTGTFATQPTIQTGTNSIGKISDITTSVVPGTGATNLGKAEDAAHTSSDTGVFVLGVRNDGAATAFTNANGDYNPLATDTQGRMYVVQKAPTATLTNVNSSATNVTVLAANTARIGAQFYNDSTAILYLKFGTTATTTSFTVPLATATYYELPGGYTGNIDGIWASANGAVRVTELT